MLKRRSKMICSIALLSVITAASLCTNAKAMPSNTNEEPANKMAQKTSFTRSGANLVAPDEEAVIEELKREGIIPEDASYEEEHQAYINYIREYQEPNQRKKNKFQMEMQEKDFTNIEDNGVSEFAAEDRDKETNVNILAICADFSDYKHNSIKPGETKMYYEDYTKEHFYNMLFGENGYTGPNGDNLVSLKQYYEEQSGGTLHINGAVTDWYTVPQTAAYYGGNGNSGRGGDVHARDFIKDALTEFAKNPSVDLADYDKIDRYDLDNDGDHNEPDGMIDYLIVIHAGAGEEEGKGALGGDAIWAHSWEFDENFSIPGTSYTDENGNTRPYLAYHYTTEPETGAAGVFCHEFAHDLGIPDEYDTQYTSDYDETVSLWSIMSSGSWGGRIHGTEPTGISPYGKQILQSIYGGKWQNQTVVNSDALDNKGTKIKLNSAALSGDVVRINLPDKTTEIAKPTSGEYAYYGGFPMKSGPMDNEMFTDVDLSDTENPMLTFKVWYDIEEGWDFASVNVKEEGKDEWKSLKGNVTTTEHNPNAQFYTENEITGTSKGWEDASFDLSEYAGKKIQLQFRYQTDSAEYGMGFLADDIRVADNEKVILSDDAESSEQFITEGFEKCDGNVYTADYYLVEWRDHSSVDNSLAHFTIGKSEISYDPGMLIWHVDSFYFNNWVGIRPGQGYLTVVDADQNNIRSYNRKTNESELLGNTYQMHDAAFGKKIGSFYYTGFTSPKSDEQVIDYNTFPNWKFNDNNDYSNKEIPELGAVLPKVDLNIEVVRQSFDDTNGTIKISKGKAGSWWPSKWFDSDDLFEDEVNTRWNHGTTPMWE